jgi:hypothetical protein
MRQSNLSAITTLESPALRAGLSALALLEQLKVPEQPPQQNKDQNRTKASTAKLFRTVAGSEAAQQLAHLGPPQRV